MKLFAYPSLKKMNRLCRNIAIVISFLLLISPLLRAEVVQPNKQYLGGSLVEYPNHGVSFTLPSNVYGIASPENPQMEFVVAVADYAEAGDNGIYIQLGAGDIDQMADQMTRPMSFKDTILNPVATPQKVDGAVYNDFEYDEEGKHYKAFMLMVRTSGNNAVFFVAASPTAIFPAYKQAVANLAKSIQFNDPTSQADQSAQNNQNTSNNVAANLAPELIGAWMRRTNASNGIYIESSSKWVFSGDGSVAWGSGAIIAGGTAGVSLRGGGDNPPDYGRWTTQEDVLRIQWNDGTQGEWSFEVFRDYNDDLALALIPTGGKRYFYRKID